MPRPPMTTRRWALTIGVIALLLVPVRWMCDLKDFYGPGGKNELELVVHTQMMAGVASLRAGRFADAEASYQAAARTVARLQAINQRHGWLNINLPNDAADRIAAGLRAARVGQGLSP